MGVGLTDGEIVGPLVDELIPLSAVITPNPIEAQTLAGLDRQAGNEQLAEAIVAAGAGAVVITDAFPEDGDWLFDGETHTAIRGDRAACGADHGAGCTHSAILAALIGAAFQVEDAAVLAHSIASRAVGLGWAIGSGRHPVDVTAAVRSHSATNLIFSQ